MINYENPINLICLECGKSFKAKIRSNAKFCSNKCGYAYRRRTGISKRGNQIKFNCLVCKKEFYKNKSDIKKYCCKKCADAGRVPPIRNMNRNIVENICKNCGKRFHKEFYKLAKFCNRKCLNEYNAKSWLKHKCKACGKEFLRRRSQKSGKAIYCSWNCVLKRGKTAKLIKKKCKVCGKEFIAPYYNFKDYKLKDGTIKKGRVTCSKECGYKLRTKEWK